MIGTMIASEADEWSDEGRHWQRRANGRQTALRSADLASFANSAAARSPLITRSLLQREVRVGWALKAEVRCPLRGFPVKSGWRRDISVDKRSHLFDLKRSDSYPRVV